MEEEPLAEAKRKTHYTKPPWWVIPVAGVAVVGCCLWKYEKFSRQLADRGVPIGVGLLGAFLLGCLAAVLLYSSEWIESEFWSGVVIWGGILVVALVICAGSILLQ